MEDMVKRLHPMLMIGTRALASAVFPTARAADITTIRNACAAIGPDPGVAPFTQCVDDLQRSASLPKSALAASQIGPHVTVGSGGSGLAIVPSMRAERSGSSNNRSLLLSCDQPAPDSVRDDSAGLPELMRQFDLAAIEYLGWRKTQSSSLMASSPNWHGLRRNLRHQRSIRLRLAPNTCSAFGPREKSTAAGLRARGRPDPIHTLPGRGLPRVSGFLYA